MDRKTLIYKTGVEYGDYTINHVLGCSHGCLYPCYAFMMAKRFGKVKDYNEWIEPKIVDNTMELLERELPKYKDKIQLLHLCFSTDPFMYGHENVRQLSMEILKAANEAGICCSVLTKGVLPLELALLPLQNEYGITIVSLNSDFTERFEPGAAPVEDRLNALKKLHERNCKTWVSIEPYPTPNIQRQSLDELLERVGFVDRIIFGRTNYSKEVNKYRFCKQYYNEQAQKVIDFCGEKHISCHIKNGTMAE